jgi:hypothetical protein
MLFFRVRFADGQYKTLAPLEKRVEKKDFDKTLENFIDSLSIKKIILSHYSNY